MRRPTVRPFLAVMLLAGVAASLGCYDTIYRLGKVEESRVDRALCGDWHMTNPSGDVTTLMAIRNADDRTYFVDWRNVEDGKSTYFVADMVEIEGAKFIHARGLSESGNLEDNHLIVRVDLDGEALTLRNLHEGFMERQGVDSDASLRKVIEANLENNDLYDDYLFRGERVQE